MFVRNRMVAPCSRTLPSTSPASCVLAAASTNGRLEIGELLPVPGVLLPSPGTGVVMSDLILGRQPAVPLEAFPPDRYAFRK